MKQNFKLTVTYDGTRYHGWEAKPGIEMTIQGKLEAVLTKMLAFPDDVQVQIRAQQTGCPVARCRSKLSVPDGQTPAYMREK